jgi:hypothetical protein
MDMIFKLDGLKKIIDVYKGDFDGPDTGVSDDGVPLTFLTNFRPHMLPVYLTAIQHAGLKAVDFGVADVAYGYNSDTGVRWVHDLDVYKGFYWNCSHDDLQKFHRAYDAVLKAHPTLKHY